MACFELQIFTADGGMAWRDYFAADNIEGAEKFALGWSALCPIAVIYKILNPDGQTVALVDLRS